MHSSREQSGVWRNALRPVHLAEYLQRYLEDHRDAITPLGFRVAYQRPCASRMSPEKEETADAAGAR